MTDKDKDSSPGPTEEPSLDHTTTARFLPVPRRSCVGRGVPPSPLRATRHPLPLAHPSRAVPVAPARAQAPGAAAGPPHLVEEVLHELGHPDVVEMPVNQQHLLQVLELWDRVVTVAGGLTTLLPDDACGGAPLSAPREGKRQAARRDAGRHRQQERPGLSRLTPHIPPPVSPPCRGFPDTGRSPMPTCASRIMLTSLAPSPMAKVMGCSLESLINLTIWKISKWRIYVFCFLVTQIAT